jgi:hypothetical protein
MEWDAPTFRVDSGGPIEIGIDGEAMRLEPPLSFESLPGALRVRIPRHALGVAPAATSVQLTGSTVRALVLTAAGRAVDLRKSVDDDRAGAGGDARAGGGVRAGRKR